MRKIIAFISIISITSCTNPDDGKNSQSRKLGDFTIKTIDSCEYIEYDLGIGDNRVYSLTHKGNCKFCKSRNKK